MASTIASKERLVLGGYFASMQDNDAKKRFLEKLKFTGGIDPYETGRKEWTDDVDLWPSITHINLAMYLVLTPSPYTGEELLYRLQFRLLLKLPLWMGSAWRSVSDASCCNIRVRQ